MPFKKYLKVAKKMKQNSVHFLDLSEKISKFAARKKDVYSLMGIKNI